MSKLTYVHDYVKSSLVDGKRTVHEERIMQGDKGVSIKFYSKKDDEIEKISIYGNDGEYKMKIQKDGKVEEKKLSHDEVVKEVSKNKKLAFAESFVSKSFKKLKGGAKSKSRTKSKSKSKSRSRSRSRKHRKH